MDFRVLFWEVDLGEKSAELVAMKEATKKVANPKAVAAQAHKAKAIAVEFRESHVWQKLAGVFEKQYAAPADWEPNFEAPAAEDWVAYPFAIVEGVDRAGCLVWDVPNIYPRVRHLRFYPSKEAAEAGNAEIARIIAAA